MASLSTAFVVLAALCWGLSGGIGGMLMADGWDPLVVSFYRGMIGLVFVLAWLALRPQGSGLGSRQLWFWSVVAGLGVAGNFSFYFVSISEGSVAVAATLMYCAPVFVYLVSFVLKLERPTPLKWAAIAMVMLGIVLLTRIYDVQPGGVTPSASPPGCSPGCRMRSLSSVSSMRRRTAAPRRFWSSRFRHSPSSCSGWAMPTRPWRC